MDLKGVGPNNLHGLLCLVHGKIAVHVPEDNALFADNFPDDFKTFDGFFVFHGDGFTAHGHGQVEALGEMSQIRIDVFRKFRAAGNGVDHEGKMNLLAQIGRGRVDFVDGKFRQRNMGQVHVVKERIPSVVRLQIIFYMLSFSVFSHFHPSLYLL